MDEYGLFITISRLDLIVKEFINGKYKDLYDLEYESRNNDVHDIIYCLRDRQDLKENDKLKKLIYNFYNECKNLLYYKNKYFKFPQYQLVQEKI